MNLLDAYVIKRTAEPYKKYRHWWVPVEANCEGVRTFTDIMCKNKEAADKVIKGFVFQV